MKKHIIFIFLLIHSNVSLFCMENEESYELIDMRTKSKKETLQLTPQQLLETINEEINNYISYKPAQFLTTLMPSFFLTQEDMIKICSLLTPYCTNTLFTEQFIASLYTYNKFFKETIDSYSNSVLKKFPSITSAILNIHKDAKNDILSDIRHLPSLLKEYILKIALNRIDYSYIIKISTPSYITHVDLNDLAGLTALACKDKNICIWNLTQGKLQQTIVLPDKKIKQISFNHNGLYLLIVLSKNIYVWDLKAKKVIFDHTSKNKIVYAQFAQSSDKRLVLHSLMKYLSTTIIETYTQKKSDFTITRSATRGIFRSIGETSETICSGKYTARFVNSLDKPTNVVTIVNHECPGVYCCKQAVNNSTRIAELNEITLSKTFQDLIPHEQTMINNLIAKKTAALLPLKKSYKALTQ